MATLAADARYDLDPSLDAEQILELAERRLALYNPRDQAYETYARYYMGAQQGMGAPSVKIANSQGRPLLRDLESVAPGGGEYRSQRLAPIVDDYQALLGRLPRSRVEPPDSAPAGIQRGEKLTKYLVSTHELSQMDLQQADMGWMLPCLGDALYLLDVAKIEGAWRVVWNVVDPREAYPAFRSGYQRYGLLDLILREYWDPYEAAARFGSHLIGDLDQGRVPLTIYISQFQRTVVVGGRRTAEIVRHTPWQLNFCPAVWVYNKINGGMAQSDIAQSLIQQDALDFLTQVGLDGAVFSTYGLTFVKGSTNLGSEGIVYGPNAPPITGGPDSAIEVIKPQTDLSSLRYLSDAMQQEIFVSTGSSEARQTGQLHSSIQTGRATHAAQGPQATRVELRQQQLGAAFRIANSMTLEMQEKAPYLGHQEFDIFGRLRGRSFLEKFNPKEDINGWYRNSVRWEQLVGMNDQQKGAIAYELKAAELIDDERALEIIGEDDPLGMIQRVEASKLHKAELEARIQGIMAGGAGGGGGAAGQPSGIGGGQPAANGQPSSSAPRNIARPLGLGADRQAQQSASPAGGGVTPGPAQGMMGVTREKVEQALQLVADKLKGTVALIGDLARQGSAQHIKAVISDFRDYGKVAPVLKALDPKAEIKAMAEDRWPDEAVRVA